MLESDLWALDENIDPSRQNKGGENQEHPDKLAYALSKSFPAKRPGADKPDPLAEGAPAPIAASSERIKLPTPISSSIRIKSGKVVDGPAKFRTESEFDDLEHWEDTSLESDQEIAEEPLPEKPPEPVVAPGLPVVEDLSAPGEIPVANALTQTPEPPRAASLDGLRKAFPSLSKIERICLITLFLVLLIGAAWIVVDSLRRLPTHSLFADEHLFPVQGKYVIVESAKTYWREPLMEGKAQDTFRRGTALLPVVELSTGAGSGGLRVVFRNNDGESVGDIVTRSVRGGQRVEIPATAGFDDVGMHAAYRTRETNPWVVEVYEAPSVDALATEFKWLFKMNISTDRR